MPVGDRSLTADRAILAAARLPAPAGVAGATQGWNVKAVVPDFQEGKRGRTPKGLGPTQAEPLAAEGNAKDWLTHTHDLAGTRYSGLTQVNTRNVSRGPAPSRHD